MEQEQLLIEASSAPPPGAKPWTKGLGSLLLQGAADGASDASRGAVRLIAINPTLRQEALRIVPVLEQMKAPCTREEIVAIIRREMPAWGVGAKTAEDYGVTFASYADALEGHSVYCIEEAVVRWNSGQRVKDLQMGGFPPRPAQLGLLAQEAKTELYMAAYRAKKAVDYVEDKRVEWTPERRREERQKAIAAGYLTKDGALQLPPAPPNPLHDARPGRSPHQVAERLRAMADGVGDVI